MEPMTSRVTADELLRMPDDGWRYELVNGELIKMTPSGFEHGAVVGYLTGRLGPHVRQHELGIVCGAETGFQLTRNPDTVRAPDIAFVRRDRVERIGVPAQFWPGAPDLAVEVTSPNDTVREVDTKARDWLAAGTTMVWVVSPTRRTVTVWRAGADVLVLHEDDVLEGGDVVPGFTCRVEDLFRDLQR